MAYEPPADGELSGPESRSLPVRVPRWLYAALSKEAGRQGGKATVAGIARIILADYARRHLT